MPSEIIVYGLVIFKIPTQEKFETEKSIVN